MSRQWKLECDCELVVNLCKTIMNIINQIPDCLRDKMPQTAVFTSRYTLIAVGVGLTQSTVACNNHAGESRITRLGMSRPDPSHVAALVSQRLDGYSSISVI